MTKTEERIIEVANESLKRVLEIRNDIQIKVMSDLIISIESEMRKAIRVNPFASEYTVLIEEDDFNDRNLFKRAFELVENKLQKEVVLLNGTVELSIDLGCIRADLKIKD